MLLRGNRPNKISKISFAQELLTDRLSNTQVPHRHAFTAKSKIRPSPNSTRTISIKPFESTHNYPLNPDSERSAEFVTKPQIGSLNNQQALAQFDNLRLEDFLKMVIVGSSKAPEVKSKEIIRSLNGTWFKNTQSSELPSNKLYNSLGIKRSRQQIRLKIGNIHHQMSNSGQNFHRQYTPPNIFPYRKYSPRKNNASKLIIGINDNTPLKQQTDCPLKASILRKTSFRQSRSSIRKRSSSYFSQSKVSPLNFSKREKLVDAQGLLIGKRMILHNE